MTRTMPVIAHLAVPAPVSGNAVAPKSAVASSGATGAAVALVIVKGAETRLRPEFTPCSSMWCNPATVSAGTVTVARAVPAASAVTTVSCAGTECRRT